jgi:hypothetical protein
MAVLTSIPNSSPITLSRDNAASSGSLHTSVVYSWWRWVREHRPRSQADAR